jgi:hypothetical protein
MRKTLPLAMAFVAALAARTVAAQTIPLNLSAGSALSLSASITVEQVVIQNGQLGITASASGNATLNGITATIGVQPLAVTASVACRFGSGTLALSTSPIVIHLSNGITATVGPLSVTATATCGRSPALTAMTQPLTITLSDLTSVSVSEAVVGISTPSSTLLGGIICIDLHDVVCELAEALATADTSSVLLLLNRILTNLTSALG